ncbi:hypothetical protein [Endomicrobium proavitum]|uniref:Uncharacterized protein n=1 Tax=Endomicrobium proavitum TaxID=1408281 RepID=A0A0G3WJE8_9BACT|nr:hypothetical protein [Endomicrobium proavitum]AKL97990.1 hypothetical protein Epro_0611 [Endomicrobium proavitum]
MIFLQTLLLTDGGGALDAQSFTYDGAIAAITYMLCDQSYKAEKILSIYQKEFYMLKNENYGIFNSYRSDKEGTNWGMVIGIDGDRMHVGPNVWVAIAALQYTAITGKLDFLKLAIDISKWTDGLTHYAFPDGQRGGVSMGSGWGPDWSTVFSTENILDDYALKKMLTEIYAIDNSEIKKIFAQSGYNLQDMKKEILNIERWLMQVVYDKHKKTFNVGYNEHGVDKIDALDTVSWAVAAVGPSRLAKMGVDPYYLMNYADKNYLVEDAIEGVKVKGYDFTNQRSRQKNYKMIWFEGTAFHIVAMQIMSQYSRNNANPKRAEYFRQKSKFFLNEMQKASQLCAMIDGALPYVSKKLGEKEIVTTFKDDWEIPRGKNGQWVASASSTGWYIIALSGFNPLAFDRAHINYKLFAKQM